MRPLAAGAVAAGLLIGGAASAAAAPSTVVILREGMPYERALADPVFGAVATRGGMGLLTHGFGLDIERELAAAAETAGDAVDLRRGPAPLEDHLEAVGEREVLVLVVSVEPTDEMLARGDDVTPVALGRGTLADFSVPCSTVVADEPGGTIEAIPGCMTGLTSDTTRRPGIVADVDLVPTVLDSVGMAHAGPGGPIRRDAEPAPTGLHRRYLEYRSVHRPAGLLLLTLVLLGLAAGMAVLFRRGPVPAAVVRWVAWAGLGGVGMAVALLALSALPRFSPLLVYPGMVLGAAAVAAGAVAWGRGDPAAPVAFVGGAGAALVAVDAVLGWRALQMPLIGGSSLEGVRFYGLGNGFGGLLFAGSTLVAARLHPAAAGAGLLGAAGMIAGLPRLGANLGVALTLFAAAGMWLALRLALRPAARVALGGIAGAGLAVVLLLLHRVADVPTHVTDALAAGDALGTFADRFLLNVRNTGATPAAWLAVAALPVGLVVAWRRLGPFGPALRADPIWRDGVVTLGAASVVGFLVNDTIGVAGMGFAFLAAALVYPSLERRWTSG